MSNTKNSTINNRGNVRDDDNSKVRVNNNRVDTKNYCMYCGKDLPEDCRNDICSKQCFKLINVYNQYI